MTATDLELLQQYARNKSEESFTALVNRHLNLVYSAALRQVRSPQLAEEVAQSVFTDLARNANKLKPDTILTAWLYQVTRRTAIDVVRHEARRQLREQIATEMNAMNATASDWTHIEPLLDEAMHALDDTDRAAVLLRYFENKSLREVGQTLDTSDDAAQKRVSRAVERLREFFAKRGVTVGASGLVVVISANAVQAAPVGLAGMISASTAAGGGTLALLKLMSMTKLKLSIISAIIVAGVATPLVIQHQAQVKLREKNQSLRQQVDGLAQLAAENESLSKRLAQAINSPALANDQLNELLKLRGEVQSLLRQNQESAQAQAGSSQIKSPARGTPTNFASVLDAPTVPLSPAASFVNAGNASPKASLETLYWAMAQHDTNTFSRELAWDPDARAKAEVLFAAAPESVRQKFGSIDGVLYALFSGVSPMSGLAVVSENIEGGDGTLIEQHQYADGRVRQNQVNVHHFDDGWRIVVGDQLLLRGFDATLKRAASANGNQ